MIKDIKIGDGTVVADRQPDDAGLPAEGADRARRARRALESRLAGEWTLKITMGAEVRGKGITETGDIPGIKNVIAVGSGKGGVGKSTMAAAIAYGLRSYGASVGLMDADVYGPSIPHLVGATGRPMARGDRIQPIETSGLKLMSMGFLLEPEKAVIMRGPMLHGIMQQFLRQVDWGTARLPGDRLAAGHRRRAADPGPGAAADRSGGGVHAARSRAARCDSCNHDVSPAESSVAGHDREHVVFRRGGLSQGPRGAGSPQALRRQGIFRRAWRRAGLYLRPRRGQAQGRSSSECRSWARCR